MHPKGMFGGPFLGRTILRIKEIDFLVAVQKEQKGQGLELDSQKASVSSACCSANAKLPTEHSGPYINVRNAFPKTFWKKLPTGQARSGNNIP